VTSLLHICRWLASTAIGTLIRESDNLFSAIETTHVLGIIFTAGTIAIVDLRILGLALVRYSVAEVLGPLVRITWLGFIVMASSGFLLFWSEADKLYVNWAFRVKLVLLLMAGINQSMFQRTYLHDIPRWDPAAIPPWRARAGAALSLGLWVGVVVMGRAIAYL
jgi:hypothetical protein